MSETGGELKPCPFCGGEAEMSDIGTCIEVGCTDCGIVNCSWQICDYLTIEERQEDRFIDHRYDQKNIDKAMVTVIKEWNRRV